MFERTLNAKKTIITGSIFKLITLIAPFILRTIIINQLGILYLGLNSLFTSILNSLNLIELGLGSAVVFSMYKPVAEGDKKKICELLYIYKKAYLYIGITILIIGIGTTPFIKLLIKGNYPQETNIYVIFLLQLFSTFAGYSFGAYKSSLLIAFQKTYIINIVFCCSSIIMYLFQVVALLFLHNYYYYVGATIIKVILQNLIIVHIANKRYPNLVMPIVADQKTKKEVFKKTGALAGHKLGGLVINSVDNILISAFIGLETVAIYNNYFYIITSLSGVFLMLTSGISSIVGNYLIEKSCEEINRLFRVIHFSISFLICFCCTCLINLIQPFMLMWIGGEGLFAFDSVVLFVVYFFCVKIRTVCLLFKDSAGLWEKDLIKPYIQVVIDLLFDFWLLQKIGINGAIISSILCMVFGYFYESIIVFNYCMNTKPNRYYLETISYLLITIASCTISIMLCSIFEIKELFLKLIVNFVISIIVSNTLFIGCTFFSKEFNEWIIFIRGLIFSDRKNRN